MDQETYGYITDDITLAVGETTKIKLGFVNTLTIIYGGMPSKDVFTIIIQTSSGYQGYSYNLFYQKDTKTMRIGKESFSVITVSPEKITLRKYR
jgi:hypothetical protein